jgi:hypothetical protein
MMPNQVRKWLRQQSKYFCAAGFDALIKQWDKCINVGGYVEKYMFFLRFGYQMFYVLYAFVIYLLAELSLVICFVSLWPSIEWTC